MNNTFGLVNGIPNIMFTINYGEHKKMTNYLDVIAINQKRIKFNVEITAFLSANQSVINN